MKYLDYQLMNKETKNKIVPKLRFPEFTLGNEWTETILGEVTYPTSQKNREGKKFPIYSINNVEGFLPQTDQFEGIDSHNRGYDISLYKLIQRNTFAYNPARINIGSLGYSGELNDIIISSLYVCFKTTDDLDDLFLMYFLKSESFNKSVKKSIEGGIRSYLFYENFAKINIQLPSIAEQQKIADCLSSLDGLITAQNQKLEALNDHKKGLMQYLFPAEGETLPKFRFAEFKDSSEWVEDILDNVATFLKGKGISKSDISPTGILPCIRYGELYTHYTEIINSVISLTNLPPDELILSEANDVIIPSSGETREDIATASCVMRGGIALGGDLNIIRSEINGVFLSYYLTHAKKSSIAKLVQGDAVVHLYSNQLKKLKINFPKAKDEQLKIANCLSFLGELVKAQEEKIEALKIHKKGLMQGLFPETDKSN